MSDVSKKPRGGRPKGSVTKRAWNLRHELEQAGFEPVAEMLELFKNTDDTDKKWSRMVWLFRHLYPQLAEVAPPPDPIEPAEDHESKRSTEELLLALSSK